MLLICEHQQRKATLGLLEGKASLVNIFFSEVREYLCKINSHIKKCLVPDQWRVIYLSTQMLNKSNLPHRIMSDSFTEGLQENQ